MKTLQFLDEFNAMFDMEGTPLFDVIKEYGMDSIVAGTILAIPIGARSICCFQVAKDALVRTHSKLLNVEPGSAFYLDSPFRQCSIRRVYVSSCRYPTYKELTDYFKTNSV